MKIRKVYDDIPVKISGAGRDHPERRRKENGGFLFPVFSLAGMGIITFILRYDCDENDM